MALSLSKTLIAFSPIKRCNDCTEHLQKRLFPIQKHASLASLYMFLSRPHNRQSLRFCVNETSQIRTVQRQYYFSLANPQVTTGLNLDAMSALSRLDTLLQKVFKIQGPGIFPIPQVLRFSKSPNLAILMDVCLCHQPQ